MSFSNASRAQNGVAPLMVDMRLATAARGHCQEMAALNYFSHQSPVPANNRLRDRVLHTGASEYLMVGENIALLDGFPQSLGEFDTTSPDMFTQQRVALARRLVQMWMDSPDHRENLLDPQFSTIGAGVVLTGTRVLAGQVFGQLPASKRNRRY